MNRKVLKNVVIAGVCMASLKAGIALGQEATPPDQAEFAREVAAMQRQYDKMPDSIGTGPYPAIKTVDPAFPGYVVYRPKKFGTTGHHKLAVLAWGNGACSADGASARLQLEEVASYGYLVLAPGSVQSGPGAPPRTSKPAPRPEGAPLSSDTKPAALTKAIDFAVAANAQPGRYHNRIDTSAIAVAGHSCGGLQALAVAGDPRVKAVVIQNSGIFPDGTTPIEGMDLGKAQLKQLHTPILYILGGPRDIAYENGMDDFRRIDHVPAMVANIDVGHLGTFAKPDGGAVARVVVNWLQWQLRGDSHAGASFTGPDCGLCDNPEWTVERKRMSAVDRQ